MAIKKKILFCGSRIWSDPYLVSDTMCEILVALAEKGIKAHEVAAIHGNANGADKMAGSTAAIHGMWEVIVPANWNVYHKAAGPMRNNVMLDLQPDIVYAFHNDIEKSKGTKHCITEAKKRGIEVVVVHDDHPE